MRGRTALPWTHFNVSESGSITGFTKGSCEVCAGDVTEGNAITLMESVARLKRLGLVQAEVCPPDIWWVDAIGATACTTCIDNPNNKGWGVLD
jgi:hypothetical protein